MRRKISPGHSLRTNPIVFKIQKTVRESDKAFHLCWVPSHISIEGNEQANRLANLSTKNPNRAANQLTRGELRTKIKKKSREAWPKLAYRPNKQMEITDDLCPQPSSTCPDQHWDKSLARLRIGHSPLTHGFYMAKTPRSTCENWGEEIVLTIRHI